jgi:signal transduction histidine kinase
VEATAYFVVSEALANVVKHANATSVSIAASSTATSLRIEVGDDGGGGADAARGSGLRGLQDRVAAMGGTLATESPAGQGTLVVAEIPIA